MAQFKLTSIKPWLEQGKPVVAYGGVAYSVTLEGDMPDHHSPYLFDLFTNQELKVNQTVNGFVEFYETSKNTTRQRLVILGPLKLSDKESLIMSQWAVRLGYEHATDHTNQQEVQAIADMAIKTALELARGIRG